LINKLKTKIIQLYKGEDMPKFRVIIHCDLKRGMEDEVMDLVRQQFIKKATDLGCHDIEFLISDENPSHIIVSGIWDNIEDAKKFQPYWRENQADLLRLCTTTPKRELFEVKPAQSPRMKKAA